MGSAHDTCRRMSTVPQCASAVDTNVNIARPLHSADASCTTYFSYLTREQSTVRSQKSSSVHRGDAAGCLRVGGCGHSRGLEAGTAGYLEVGTDRGKRWAQPGPGGGHSRGLEVGTARAWRWAHPGLEVGTARPGAGHSLGPEGLFVLGVLC